MKRMLIITVLTLACCAAIIYGGDYGLLRYKMGKGHEVIASVPIYRYYAVPEKNNRTEFISADPDTVKCIEALFPHLSYAPCWYVRRHADQRVNM
jgi:hypothetical protein